MGQNVHPDRTVGDRAPQRGSLGGQLQNISNTWAKNIHFEIRIMLCWAQKGAVF
jgi:hypothetical protein